MEFLIAAISLGALGSFHCVGMCGPIALSLPVGNKKGFTYVLAILTYNSGRIFTYSVLGFLFGYLGKLFFIAGWQQILSVSVGSLILLFTLIPEKSQPDLKFFKNIFVVMNKLKSFLSKLFLKKGNSTLFSIGLLNGLLPCGLVYAGLAGSAVTGSEWKGAAFMAVFGLGTVPLMLTVSLFKNLFSISFRSHLRKAVPYFVSVMAVMLILRGLNLGIPFVSPKIDQHSKTISSCCSDKKITCRKNK